ncbi:MAG: UvrD-helicase domain-containing protein [Treponema sp.]|nr:UvrD-helicase domain-containing protein [Treponema sp.]
MGEKTFDKYQKDAINAIKNSVVSAGAGSGKTTVLAERFSTLVLDPKTKAGVDQILTLTFTKKATVEMSARIYKVLKKHNPAKAADFYKANIKTIDSYCNGVAKMGCHYYGVSPDFTQNDEELKKSVYAMALPYILEHRNNEAIKALVTVGSFDDVAKELFVDPVLANSTVAEPIDFDAMFHKQVQEIVARWNNCIKETDGKIAEIQKGFLALGGNVNRTSKSYEAYNAVFGPESDFEIPEPVEVRAEDVESCNIEDIKNYILAVKTVATLKCPSGKGIVDLKVFTVPLQKELFPQLCNIFTFIYGYRYTKSLIPLLKEFQDKVNGYKRSSGILSFKDISNMAKCILRDFPEIRKIEKEKYKFIMIDEFQDNNKDQRDMLFMLAEKLSRKEPGVPKVEELEKEKLFFVGDEKQSIYLFRGADVSVFNSLSEDFKEGNLNMTTNYRSESALIKSFNTIFGGFEYPLPAADIEKKESKPEEQAEEQTKKKSKKKTEEKTEESLLPKENPSAFYNDHTEYENEIPKYEAVYKEVLLPAKKQEEADVKENTQKIFAPHIHFALFDKEQEVTSGSLTTENAEAQWVADKINEITSKGLNGKVYDYSDIAILMRSYGPQPLYERTFLKNGIPYNTEVVTGFFADGPVNDIFSMLRLCAYPDDTAAYAQVLRSPWVNLSFEQANEIIFTKERNQMPFSQDVSAILPEQALKRFNHAKAFFNELNESARTEPLTKTVTKLWYSTGYRYETMWNKTVTMYGKLYDLIFELARKSEENKMTLGAFVDSVRTYRDQSEKLDDMDIPLEQAGGVHILSIHKSKGLEYPVVFVIGTNKKGKNESNSKATYTSKKYGITINTPGCAEIAGKNPFYEEAHQENRAQKGAELRRLTYVALTRAEEHIFITSGKYKANKNCMNYVPGGPNIPDSIFAILEPVYNYYFAGRDYAQVSGPFSRTFILSDELSKGTKTINAASAKIQLLEKIDKEENYSKIKPIVKENPKQIYAKPSQLHEEDEEEHGTKKLPAQNAANACAEYDRINKIIDSTKPKSAGTDAKDKDAKEKEPAFSHANFGTIAHAYLEAKINGTEPVISNRDTVGLENKTEALEEIKNICQMMADKFAESDIGKKALASVWHKAEYDFRSRLTLKDGTYRIIKGSIDLVFENPDGTYTIVDYKTNQELKPEIYINQLACYRMALGQMLNIGPEKISCSLYYLRFNKEADITKETENADLSSIVLRTEEK